MSSLPQFPSEKRTYTDRVSGATVHQLTQHMAHSYHLYFTNSGWWGGGRHLLFGSDRGNRSNVYSMDVQTTAITQLTDNAPSDRPVNYQGVAINPVRDEAYWWHEGSLYALDLVTARVHVGAFVAGQVL